MIDILLLVVSGAALLMTIGCIVFGKLIDKALVKRGYVRVK